MSNKTQLSVSDLIILIAATAPGLALARCMPDYIAIDVNVMVNTRYDKTSGMWSTEGMGWDTTGGKYTKSTGRPFRQSPSYWLAHIPCWGGPCLLSWTIASLTLGLWGPRPSFQRMARRPGMAAGLAVVLALAVEGMGCLRLLATSGVGFASAKDGWGMYFVVSTSFVRMAGFSVAACWLGLALSGRWSAEQNAGGRLGRALGWCWIAMAVSLELGVWCFALNC